MRGGTAVEGATPAPAAPRRATAPWPFPRDHGRRGDRGRVLPGAGQVRPAAGRRARDDALAVVRRVGRRRGYVAGVWAVRATHPLASTGLAVATAGSLLPLWAALPWLPGPVRAGVLAAAPLTVAGVAQVALGWPADPSPAARRAGQAIYTLAGAAGLAHLLGYNPFADPGCFRTCEDVAPLLGGLVTTQAAVTIASLLTIAAAAVATAAILAARTARTHPAASPAPSSSRSEGFAISAAMRLAGWGMPWRRCPGSPWSPSPWPSSAPWCGASGSDGAYPRRHRSVGGPRRPGGGVAPVRWRHPRGPVPVAGRRALGRRGRPARTSTTHRHRAATWSSPTPRDRCSASCWPGVPTRARSSPA